MTDSKYHLSYDYNAGLLHIYNDAGQLIRDMPATSGRPGTSASDQALKDVGPIPEGKYLLDPSEFSEAGFFRHLMTDLKVVSSGFLGADWGNWRAPLHPEAGTDTLGRSGFFIHGGLEPGSAGCIDLGKNDTELHNLLMDQQGPIEVIVSYPPVYDSYPHGVDAGPDAGVADGGGSDDDEADAGASDAESRSAGAGNYDAGSADDDGYDDDNYDDGGYDSNRSNDGSYEGDSSDDGSADAGSDGGGDRR